MRKIPFKNYILLVFLLVFTVLLTFWVFSFYESKKSISPLYKYLNSIKKDELEEFIMENPDSMIFALTKDDISNIDNQKDIKKKIEKNNLKDYSIFLKLDSIEELQNINLDGYVKKACPSVIFVESGSITDVFCIEDINFIIDKIDDALND